MTRRWWIEWRLLARSGTWRWVAPSLPLLCVLSLWFGSVWREAQSKTIEDMFAHRDSLWTEHLADARRFVEGTLDTSYLSPLDHYVAWAFTRHAAGREPHPLGLLAVGQSDLHLNYDVWSSVTPNALFHEAEIVNPVAQALGRLNFALVAMALFPLALIGLGFDLSAADRDQGRLVLLLGQGVSPAGLYLSRALTSWAALTVVTLPVIAVSILVLSPSAGSLIGLGGLGAALGILVAYTAFWQAAIFAINGLGRSALWNGSMLLFLWCALVLLAPGALDRWAGGSDDMHLQDPMEAWVADLSVQDDSAYGALVKEYEGVVALPEAPMGSASWVARFEAVRDQRMERHRTRREVLESRYDQVRRVGSWIPSTAIYLTLIELARADTRTLLAYRAERDAFEAEWAEKMRLLPLQGSDYDLAALEGAPRWTGTEVHPQPGLRLILQVIAVLAAFTSALLLIGWRAFERARRLAS